eukprot:14255_1
MEISNDCDAKSPMQMQMIVVGDDGVGKTSLIQRYVLDSMTCRYTQPRIAKTEILRDDSLANITILDASAIALQEEDYRKADCIIICYDVTNAQSFANAHNKWAMKLESYGIQRGEVTVFVLGCKSDLSKLNRAELEAQSQTVVNKGKLKLNYGECSAKSADEVHKAFQSAAEMVYQQAEFYKKRIEMQSEWNQKEKQYMETIQTLKDENHTQHTTRAQMEHDMKSQREEVNAFHLKIKLKLDECMEQFKQEKKTLNEQLQQLKGENEQRVAEIEKSNKELMQKYTNTQQQLEQKTKDIDALTKQKNEMKTMEENHSKYKVDKMNEIKELNESNVMKQSLIDAAVKDKNELDTKYQNVMEKLNRLEGVNKEYNECKLKVQQLDEALKTKDSEYKQLEIKQKQIQTEYKTFKAEYQDIVALKPVVEAKYDNIEITVSHNEKRLKITQRRMEDLHVRIASELSGQLGPSRTTAVLLDQLNNINAQYNLEHQLLKELKMILKLEKQMH